MGFSKHSLTNKLNVPFWNSFWRVGMSFRRYSAKLALEKAWAWFPVPCTPGMVAHTYCPHTLEVKVGKQLKVTLHCKVWGQPERPKNLTLKQNQTMPCWNVTVRLGSKRESLLNCVTGDETFTLQWKLDEAVRVGRYTLGLWLLRKKNELEFCLTVLGSAIPWKSTSRKDLTRCGLPLWTSQSCQSGGK